MPNDHHPWPPPAVFQPSHGGRRAGEVVYLRCEVIGFDERGTAFVKFVNKDRSECEGTPWVAVDLGWTVGGKTVVDEIKERTTQ